MKTDTLTHYAGTPQEVIGVDESCTNCGWTPDVLTGELHRLHAYDGFWQEDPQQAPGIGQGWMTIQCQRCSSFFRVDMSS